MGYDLVRGRLADREMSGPEWIVATIAVSGCFGPGDQHFQTNNGGWFSLMRVLDDADISHPDRGVHVDGRTALGWADALAAAGTDDEDDRGDREQLARFCRACAEDGFTIV